MKSALPVRAPRLYSITKHGHNAAAALFTVACSGPRPSTSPGSDDHARRRDGRGTAFGPAGGGMASDPAELRGFHDHIARIQVGELIAGEIQSDAHSELYVFDPLACSRRTTFFVHLQ